MPALRKLMIIAAASLPLAAASAEPKPCAATGAVPAAGPEMSDIIQNFSKRTGRKFNIDPRVRAIPMFAGIDPDKITYEQLLATLSVHQFVTYVQDDVVFVLPDALARQLPTPVYTDTSFKADDNEWVTLLLSPKKACVAHMVPILRPLMPQAGHMAAYPDSSSLVLTDRSANLRRIADLVDKLDKAATGKQDCAVGKSGS